VNPPPPEVFEQEMKDTRESLRQKVAALEETVVGTVDAVKNAMKETADTVKQSVHTVTDTVKEGLNVSAHIRNRPWLCVGISAAAGFLTGFLVGSRREAGASVATRNHLPFAAPAAAPAAAEPREPGLFGELMEKAGREVRKIADHAIATAAETLKRNISEGMPHLMDTAARELPTVLSHRTASRAGGACSPAGV